MRALAYIRVSKDKEDGYSPSTQLGKIRDYCRARGWTLMYVYRDLDESGRKEDRPDFQRMIERIKEGDIDYVVVYRVDRFSRSTRDFLYYLDILEQHGANLASVNESFDASTPFGRAMVSMLAVFAQLESDSIGERIRDNLTQAVRQRKIHLGAHPPYGYRRKKGRLIVDPEKAKHVRWIYERYLAGEGTRTLASQLTQAHVPTPRGKRIWRYTAIRSILSNPAYAGYIRYNGEILPGDHEAIIDSKMWHQVQEAMEARSGGPRTTGPTSVLGRLLRCELCNTTGNLKNSGYGAVRYICTTRVQSTRSVCNNVSLDAPSLERAIVRMLLSGLDALSLRRHIDEQKRLLLADQTRMDTRAELRRRKETLQAAMDRLFSDHYEHNIITREQFIAANERYLEEVREIDARLAELEQADRTVMAREADIDIFLQRLTALSAWDEMTPVERRTVLRPLIGKIVWGPDKAIMHLQFGEQVELPYFDVKQHVAYFDDAHWPKCPTCGRQFRTPAALGNHRRWKGH